MATSQQQNTKLNSDRIWETFGSYGIDVLEDDATHRISRLYSRHQGRKVTRTLGVVRYVDEMDPRLLEEHRDILEGESIGLAFRDNDRSIVKHHEFVGEFEASPDLAAEFGIDVSVPLAVNAYALAVAIGGEQVPYAAIAEIHHPDHLRLADLRDICGSDVDSRDTQETAGVLDLARAFVRTGA